jgi:hypothetical protein
LLGTALLALLAWLVGPLSPARLGVAFDFVPPPGRSHVHTILVATWWAAALNAALCALLLASAGVWMRAPSAAAFRRGPRRGAAFWVPLAVAVLLAGALRWPLAQGSLWWDEAWNIRNTVVGKLDTAPDDPGRTLFQRASWLRTLWYYHSPTNHVGFTVPARLSTELWRAASGAGPQAFDEFAYRLPAYAAALCAVAMAAVLVAALGFPRAGLAAAFLLAVHPLHVRYGADGRGYSLVVLLTLAGACLLLRALRDGGWRWWLAYGASQLWLLWTFPLGVYVPLAFGFAGLAAIALDGERSAGDRALLAARFLVANVLAAMAFFALMAPNLAQAAAFDKEWRDAGRIDLFWLQRFWVMMSSGLALRGPRQPDVWFPTLAALGEAHPALRVMVYGLLPLSALAGIARALRAGSARERAVWLGLLAPTALFLGHRELQSFFILPRFVIFALPAAVCFPALGLEGLLAALARGRPRLVGLGLGLALAGFAAAVSPALGVLAAQPASPSRELVALLDAVEKSAPAGILRAGLGLGGDAPRIYDPRIVEVERPEQLEALCERSRAEGRPLYVFYAYGTVNQKRLPGLFIWVGDPLLFEPVARLDGIDHDMVIRLRRYTGRPLPKD